MRSYRSRSSDLVSHSSVYDHNFTSSRPTALHPTTYTPYLQGQTPCATSKGGHSKTTGQANTKHTHPKSRRTHCTMHAVPLTSHGPDTYKGAQNDEHSAYLQTQKFTNREYGQHRHPIPSSPAQVSSQVPSKSRHARPQRNFRSISTIPTTAQAPQVCTHLEHLLCQ